MNPLRSAMVKYSDQRHKKVSDKITGVEEMQSMAFDALEARRAEVGLDLVGGVPLVNGEPIDHFMVAYRDCKFRTDSVVGTINRGQFEDMLGAALHDAQHKVEHEIDGRWMPVSWSIQRNNRQRRNRKATVEAERAHSAWSVETEADAKPRPGKQAVLYENDAILVIEVVYVEVDQVAPTDVLFRRNGTKGSAMAQFARTNGSESDEGRRAGTPYNFRAMPRRMRDERERSIALLAEFAGALKAAEEAEAEAPQPPTSQVELNDAQIAFAREQLAQGVKTSHVAAILNLSHQRLTAVLRSLDGDGDAAAGADSAAEHGERPDGEAG